MSNLTKCGTTPLPCGLLLLSVLCLSCVVCLSATPLDDYIRKDDGAFRIEPTDLAVRGLRWTAYVYILTSQRWLTPRESNCHLWRHQLAIVLPKHIHTPEHPLLFITGGHNTQLITLNESGSMHGLPSLALAADLAVAAGVPAAVLYQVPNQPLRMPDDPQAKSRSEDSAVALAWWRFIHRTANPEGLLELPMTKAAVRALDAMEYLLPKYTGVVPKGFSVAGASKRGWATWLVAAVDPRVIAIVPLVLDMLDVILTLHRQYCMYNGWSYVLKNYYAMNLTASLDTGLPSVMSIIDPFQYLSRLSMPKMVVTATGDEFQMPDDTRYWSGAVTGPIRFLALPNAEHTLLSATPTLIGAVGAFLKNISLSRDPGPSYHWTIDELTGTITAVTSVPPKRVVVSWADSPQGVSAGKRDFRWAALHAKPCLVHVLGGCLRPVLWKSTSAEQLSPTIYRASFSPPKHGWKAFLIELYWDGVPGGSDYHFTTPVSVIPNKLPFPGCHGASCRGTLM